jgi:hypothetical protein
MYRCKPVILPSSRMVQGFGCKSLVVQSIGWRDINRQPYALDTATEHRRLVLSSPIKSCYTLAPSVMLFLWSLFALLAAGAALPAPSSSEENSHACGDLIREAHESKYSLPVVLLHEL